MARTTKHAISTSQKTHSKSQLNPRSPMKKSGGGKGNWGKSGVEDMAPGIS
jgi:hypothetical protein